MQALGFIVSILGLFFLFLGEPDVWDAMHARAMGRVLECPKPAPAPVQKKNTFWF